MNNRREKIKNQRINQKIQHAKEFKNKGSKEKLTRYSQGNPMRKISREDLLFLL